MHSHRAVGATDLFPSVGHLLGSAAVVLLAITGSGWAFAAIWNRSAVADVTGQPAGWSGAIVVVVLGAAVHELLHAAGWVILGRLAWRSLSITPTWRKLGLVIQVSVPVPPRVYRRIALVPLLLLAVPAVVFGLAADNGLLLLWGLLFLLECFADVVRVLVSFGVPRDQRVMDLTGTTGLRVVPVVVD